MALLGRWSPIAWLAVLALCAGVAPQLVAQDLVYDASQVKAAFLYHFGTYVQWPMAAAENDPITIAVLGDDAVAAQLVQFLPGRRIEGRAVEARPLARIEDLADEEILFVGSEHNERLGEVLSAVEERPVLVVTDAADGLDHGAMVNFQLVDSRVRFEISLPSAEEAGLVLSSRLLSAALRVITSECCRNEVERGFAVGGDRLADTSGRG